LLDSAATSSDPSALWIIILTIPIAAMTSSRTPDPTPPSVIEWKPEYSFGLSVIDAEHQRLFALARQLYDLIGDGNETCCGLGGILSELAEYIGEYFSHEKHLMEQSRYHLIDQHLADHLRLTGMLSDIILDFEKMTAEPAGDCWRL